VIETKQTVDHTLYAYRPRSTLKGSVTNSCGEAVPWLSTCYCIEQVRKRRKDVEEVVQGCLPERVMDLCGDALRALPPSVHDGEFRA
jgi:hypothetical protein